MMIKGIRHIGLVVEDVEKALLFYQDFLGFKIYWDKIEKGSFIETISAISPLSVRTIKMKSANGCVLELLCYDSCSRSSYEKKLCQAGFAHMAITVDDIDGIFVFLKEKGVRGLHFGTFSEEAKNFFLKSGFTVLFQGKRTYLESYLGKELNFYVFGWKFSA